MNASKQQSDAISTTTTTSNKQIQNKYSLSDPSSAMRNTLELSRPSIILSVPVCIPVVSTKVRLQLSSPAPVIPGGAAISATLFPSPNNQPNQHHTRYSSIISPPKFGDKRVLEHGCFRGLGLQAVHCCCQKWKVEGGCLMMRVTLRLSAECRVGT